MNLSRAAFAILILLLSSCRTPLSEPEQNLYAEQVSKPRLDGQLARGELVLGLAQSPDAEKESKTAADILARHDLKLKVLYADRSELPPLLRSGKVDLIAGAFSEEEILRLHLVPVFPGSDRENPKKHYVFAVRRGNPQLEKILNAPPTTTEKKENVRMDRKTQN